MKHLTSILIALVIAGACMVSNAKTYALVVGVTHYADTANKDQPFRIGSVKRMSQMLEKKGYEVTLYTSRYATTKVIEDRIKLMCQTVKENDRIMIHLLGHGYAGGFATHDGYLDYSTLVPILAQAKAKQVYLFIDACFTGSISTDVVNYDWKSAGKYSNLVIMTASRGDEQAYGWSGYWGGGGSLFTDAIITGMEGEADANSDKKITVKELFTYICDHIQEDLKQMKVTVHPQLISSRKMRNAIVTGIH